MIHDAGPIAIEKELTANDVGATGTHQAGICVPRDPRVLAFFPTLSTKEKNPRRLLDFLDAEGVRWTFAFIYYNNRFFGGTRNEYRLTRTGAYIVNNRLIVGDFLILRRNAETAMLTISHRKSKIVSPISSRVLKLSSVWKEIKI
jgi:hypothetical protein